MNDEPQAKGLVQGCFQAAGHLRPSDCDSIGEKVAEPPISAVQRTLLCYSTLELVDALGRTLLVAANQHLLTVGDLPVCVLEYIE